MLLYFHKTNFINELNLLMLRGHIYYLCHLQLTVSNKEFIDSRSRKWCKQRVILQTQQFNLLMLIVKDALYYLDLNLLNTIQFSLLCTLILFGLLVDFLTLFFLFCFVFLLRIIELLGIRIPLSVEYNDENFLSSFKNITLVCFHS